MNLGQKMIEIIVRVQAVGFCCLDNAVDDSTGLCARDRIDHQPVPASHCKAADRGFRQLS